MMHGRQRRDGTEKICEQGPGDDGEDANYGLLVLKRRTGGVDMIRERSREKEGEKYRRVI